MEKLDTVKDEGSGTNRAVRLRKDDVGKRRVTRHRSYHAGYRSTVTSHRRPLRRGGEEGSAWLHESTVPRRGSFAPVRVTPPDEVMICRAGGVSKDEVVEWRKYTQRVEDVAPRKVQAKRCCAHQYCVSAGTIWVILSMIFLK
jgi:hypothetical protein